MTANTNSGSSPDFGTDFGPVGPVKFAEAFGAAGLIIRTVDALAPVLRKAFEIPGPGIVGVHVDYRDNHKLLEAVDADNIH